MSPRQHTDGPNRKPNASRPPSDSALIIFAKAPIPGQVKTRLCPPLTPDEAASLHGSVVLDMLERSRGTASLDRFVACAPSSDHVFFKILEERHGVRLIAQMGDDLGARMARAIADVFALGYRQVLVIGTDLPTLPGSVFGETVKLLASHDVVLGPALDGGYYLIGLRKPSPGLFAGIPWSTDRVLPLTQQKAAALGLRTTLLQVRRDIDTVDDLTAVIEEMGVTAGTRTIGDALSLRTAGVLRLLAGRLHIPAQRTSKTMKTAASL
ncbi:MAG: glycosyltransferase [Nitrospiraceae bacterium]|nr:glycosyltransferase [Nitrospiraceae bacterium]